METTRTRERLWAPARFRGRAIPLVVRLAILALSVGSLVTDAVNLDFESSSDVLRAAMLCCLTLGFPLTLWFSMPGAALSLVGVAAGVVADPVPTVFFAGVQMVLLAAMGNTTVTRRYSWSVLLLMLVGIGTANSYERIAPTTLALVTVAVLVQQRRSDALRSRLGDEVRARQAAERSARAAVMQERRALANDLHDIVAHDLTIMGLQADMALIKADAETQKRALSLISASSREALSSLRMMIDTLQDVSSSNPPTASFFEVMTITANRLRSLGYSVALTIADDMGEPSPETVSLASQILRECSTNVAKHADPRCQVRIDCWTQGRDLFFTFVNPMPSVRDDSIDPLQITVKGQGSVSMTDRAAAVSGSLTLGPDNGEWVVSVRLPLTPARV